MKDVKNSYEWKHKGKVVTNERMNKVVMKEKLKKKRMKVKKVVTNERIKKSSYEWKVFSKKSYEG